MSFVPTRIPARETATTEFKTSFGSAVIEALAAFANSRGGRVYVGVNDKGAVTGVHLSQETTAQWINEIKTKTYPSLMPDIDILDVSGKKVIVLSQPEFPIKPVAYQGRYLVRKDNSNHQMSTAEVVDMNLRTFNSSWDYYLDSDHSLDSISLDKVQQTIERINQDTLRIVESPLDYLRKQDLLRDDKITHAAYLMFTKHDSPMTVIELGYFQTETVIKDSRRSKSDIITQVSEVLDFVRKHINKQIIITPNPKHEERWDYPMEAIREIVLNMIVHRDYRSSADSVVKVFPNKIEFYNPGVLPNSLTIEDLLTNNYVSTPRNKMIADLFKDRGDIEKYGSGIRRIVQMFTEYGLNAPTFQTIADGFKVTVFALSRMSDKTSKTSDKTDSTSDKTSKTSDKTGSMSDKSSRASDKTGSMSDKTSKTSDKTDSMSDKTSKTSDKSGSMSDKTSKTSDKSGSMSDNKGKEAEILLFLRGRENGSTAEIADQIRLSLPQTRRILARMAVSGQLIAEGANRNRRYCLADSNRR